MCCMGGCGLMPLSGMVDASSLFVNTDRKCWLSMLALVRLSGLMNPFCLGAAQFLLLRSVVLLN